MNNVNRVVTYFVDWKTIHRPGDWERYSVLYTDPQQAVSSYEAAEKNPQSIDLRCCRRIVIEQEIPFEVLKQCKAESKPWENEIPLARECFGSSGFAGRNKK